jgi:MFS family permease
MTGEARPYGAYRWYVLGLFTLVYAFNFIDRQIVIILAPSLKADLGLTDAQLGLLFGTAFALFYALFGVPLAKLADGWHRVRTLSLGLSLWSALTACSGLAGHFAQLALARVGVGVGEASAAPAAFSILQDYFPKRQRATALALYSCGIYLGSGASLMIGGGIVAAWDRLAASAAGAPFALKGWQAAYLAVGLPGLLLALLLLLTVREPVRGAIDGQPQPPAPDPFRAALRELGALFPLFGRSRANLALLLACILGAVIATEAAGHLLAPDKRALLGTIAGLPVSTNLVQWAAIAIGVYATGSWVQSIRRRDPAAAALIVDSPSFVALAVGGGLLSLSSYGIAAFLYVYGKSYLGLPPEAGFTLGAISAVAGGLGTAIGGIVADRARLAHPAGRLWVAGIAATLSTLLTLWQYNTASVTHFYLAYGLATLCLTMWLGPVFATCQDHVLPRMRGVATAVQLLGTNLIGLGLGPYLVGLVSDVTGDLRLAILSVLALVPIVLALFAFAARRLPAMEASLLDRARAAGERV